MPQKGSGSQEWNKFIRDYSRDIKSLSGPEEVLPEGLMLFGSEKEFKYYPETPEIATILKDHRSKISYHDVDYENNTIQGYSLNEDLSLLKQLWTFNFGKINETIVITSDSAANSGPRKGSVKVGKMRDSQA